MQEIDDEHDWEKEVELQQRRLALGDMVEVDANATRHLANLEDMLSPTAAKSTADINSESDIESLAGFSTLGHHAKMRAKSKVPGAEPYYTYNDRHFKSPPVSDHG